jgi:hypothetical protein
MTRMSRADRRAWKSARTLADLGELTARWLEGAIASQPGYCGPSDLDDPDRLVPLFAALCRAGYMTTQSQAAHDGPGYDGVHWEQRAAVEGFASPEIAARIIAAAERNGLHVIARDPQTLPRWRNRSRDAVPVTTRNGATISGFGMHLSRRFLRDDLTGYGMCHPDAVGALCNAWQVTVIDPEWGRADVLWCVLSGAVLTKGGATA